MDWVEQQKRSLEQDGVDLPAQDQAEAAPAQDAAALRNAGGRGVAHHIGASGWRGTATSSGSTSISGTRSLFRNAPRSRRGM